MIIGILRTYDYVFKFSMIIIKSKTSTSQHRLSKSPIVFNFSRKIMYRYRYKAGENLKKAPNFEKLW